MCCKRKERRALTAVTIAGAAYERQNSHPQLEMHTPSSSTRSYPAIMPKLLRPEAHKTSPTYHTTSKQPSGFETDAANPPSYEAVVNGTTMPEDSVADSTRTSRLVFPDHVDGTDVVSLNDDRGTPLFLTDQKAAVGVPAGRTWWEAYRARKAERREAWRAEKAEWRALRRAGRC